MKEYPYEVVPFFYTHSFDRIENGSIWETKSSSAMVNYGIEGIIVLVSAIHERDISSRFN